MSNEIVQLQLAALKDKIEERNLWVEKINAVTGDKDSLTESIRESAEFENLRNQIADLQDELDAAVEVKVEEALASQQSDEGEVSALKEQVRESDKTVKSGVKFLKEMYPDQAEVIDGLPKLNRVRGVKRTGGRRIKGFNIIVSDADGVNEFDNFSGAAKYLGCDTKDLQEAFFAKAGVEKLKDVPDVVEFGMSWVDTDEDGTETEVEVGLKAYRTAEEETEETESGITVE